MMRETDDFTVRLDHNSALVLFELLARNAQADRFDVVHEAEHRVLAAIEADLEAVLVEPLDPNYRALVDDARRAVTADS